MIGARLGVVDDSAASAQCGYGGLGDACVVAGVAIPALIALATFTLGKAVRS